MGQSGRRTEGERMKAPPLNVAYSVGRVPDFDLDLGRGKQAELRIGDILSWLAAGNGRVEVKRKEFLDLDFYIEQEHDPGNRGDWRASGITTSKADVWIVMIGDTDVSVLFPTSLIRLMLTHSTTRDRQCKRGSCQTRGKLINLGALLYECRKRQGHT
jgi:hypothetical protein